MPFFSTLTSPAPYHLLSYSTLLGASLYQSFVGGTIAYKALPRPQFASLQSAIFPVYFALQTGLPVALAATFPGPSAGDHGPSGGAAGASSLAGILEPTNRWSALVPVLAMFACGAANWMAVGPWTTGIMKRRKHQETRDGKKYYDKGPHSPEMEALNKQFMKAHGVSSLLNLGALIATLWYGIGLAERIQ